MQLDSTAAESMYSGHTTDLDKDFGTTDTDPAMYQQQDQFSPTSWNSSYDQFNNFLTPQSSPINDLNTTEETYDFSSSTYGNLSLPFPSSQDYEEHAFEKEIDDICNNFSNDKKDCLKMEEDYPVMLDEFTVLTNSQCTESSQQIIWEDKMLTEAPLIQVVRPQIPDDTLNTPQVEVIPFSFTAQQETESQSIPAETIDYFEQYSPVSVDDNKTNDEINENEGNFKEILEKLATTSQPDLNIVKKEEECLQQYNIIITQTEDEECIMETTESPVRRRSARQRVPSLKLKIVRPIEQAVQSVSTPQITNDILDMEGEKFDLISYVDSPEPAVVEVKPMIDRSARKRIAIELAEYITSPVKSKRRRSSYEDPASVQSCQSFDSQALSSVASPHQPKRRGRPPKPLGSTPSPSHFSHLNSDDMKYAEMRNKNNEASRRSRMNRRDKETAIFQEADQLERMHKELSAVENQLKRDCNKWRRAVMKLALL